MSITLLDALIIAILIFIMHSVLSLLFKIIKGIISWAADKTLSRWYKVSSLGEPMLDYNPIWELLSRITKGKANKNKRRRR